MGVKLYKPGEHPGGFIGFRVSAAPEDGFENKYFSTSECAIQDDEDLKFKRQRLLAELTDAEWSAASILRQYQKFVSTNHPATKPLRGVGVHSLTARIWCDRTGNWRAGFFVRRGRGDVREFAFELGLYSEVWAKAVNTWADAHEVLDEDRERVLAAKPDPEQFRELRRYMNDHEGCDIPVEVLGPVFREQREELKKARALQQAKDLKIDRAAPVKMEADMQADMTAWFEAERNRASA